MVQTSRNPTGQPLSPAVLQSSQTHAGDTGLSTQNPGCVDEDPSCTGPEGRVMRFPLAALSFPWVSFPEDDLRSHLLFPYKTCNNSSPNPLCRAHSEPLSDNPLPRAGSHLPGQAAVDPSPRRTHPGLFS